MSKDIAPGALLEEMTALRRRTRADRHAYWFPLLFFGMTMIVAIPVHALVPIPQTSSDETGRFTVELFLQPDEGRIGRYWMVALLVGAAVTVWWYRRRGRRTGVEGRVGAAVVAAALAVAAYFATTLLPIWNFEPVAVLWWIELRDLGALLVIAVGLLALAALERSWGLTVVAVLYAGAAVLVNFYDLENVLWFPGERYVQLPSLLLPAVVLLVGGTVALGRAALARRRTA